MTNIQRLNSMSEIFPQNVRNLNMKDDLIELKLFLKHLRHKLKFEQKWQKMFKQKAFKCKRKLKVSLKILQKLKNKIIRTKKLLKKILKALRAKRQAKRLELKRRLVYLKEMSKVRKSVRKIYLKELKAQKRISFRNKKHYKKEPLMVKKIRNNIENMVENLENLEEDIILKKRKIKYLKEKSDAMNPGELRMKIRKIKRKLLVTKRLGRVEQQPMAFLLATAKMIYQKTPRSKIKKRNKYQAKPKLMQQTDTNFQRTKLLLTTTTSGHSKRSLGEIKATTRNVRKRLMKKKSSNKIRKVAKSYDEEDFGRTTSTLTQSRKSLKEVKKYLSEDLRNSDLSSSTVLQDRKSSKTSLDPNNDTKKLVLKKKSSKFRKKSKPQRVQGLSLSTTLRIRKYSTEVIEPTDNDIKKLVLKKLFPSKLRRKSKTKQESEDKESENSKYEYLRISDLSQDKLSKSESQTLKKTKAKTKILKEAELSVHEMDQENIKRKKSTKTFKKTKVLEQPRKSKSSSAISRQTKTSLKHTSESAKEDRKSPIAASPKKRQYKSIEALPIGDDFKNTKRLSGRLSKKSLKRKNKLARTRSSQGDFKTPTSTTTSAESEVPSFEVRKHLTETKTKAKQDNNLIIESLDEISKVKVAKNLPAPIQFSEVSVERDKRLTLDLNELRNNHNKSKPKKKIKSNLDKNLYGKSTNVKPMQFRSYFFKRPVDKRTMQSITVSRIKKDIKLKTQNKRKTVTLVTSEDEHEQQEEDKQHKKQNEPEAKTPIILLKVDDNKELTTLPTSPIIKKRFSRAKRRSTAYDDKFKKLYKAQKDAINKKLQEERQRQQELNRQMNEKAKEDDNKSLRRRRSTSLSESVKMNNLVKIAMKSNYNLVDVVPEDISVIDDNILKMTHKSHRLNIGDMFPATKHYIESTMNISSEHLKHKSPSLLGTGDHAEEIESSESSSTSSTQKLQTKHSAKLKTIDENEPEEQEKVAPEVMYDNEFYEELNTEDKVIDLLKYALAQKNVEKVKKSEQKPKKLKKSKTRKTVRDDKTSKRESKIEDEEKYDLKIICSSCGMTNLQPGGPCCPLILKNK